MQFARGGCAICWLFPVLFSMVGKAVNVFSTVCAFCRHTGASFKLPNCGPDGSLAAMAWQPAKVNSLLVPGRRSSYSELRAIALGMSGDCNAALGRKHLKSCVELYLGWHTCGADTVPCSISPLGKADVPALFPGAESWSLLLVAALCHADAVRQVPTAVWHMLLMWERESHCDWVGALAGAATWLWWGSQE